jgi:Cellulase (glycosyl hydrolase family 5)
MSVRGRNVAYSRNVVSKGLTLALFVVLILASSGVVFGSNSPVSKYNGVDYLTLYNEYDTPTQQLTHDFAILKEHGLNTIVIVMYWYRLEPKKGVYDQQFIRNVIHVANVANEFGLKVMIDFHSKFGPGGRWSVPDYVGDAMNMITNSTVANGYLAMVTWAVNQLKGVPNIWSYSVVNEPWYWPLDNWREVNFVNLMVELSHTVKLIDGRPVTVRFVGALFERDWNWDPNLLNALDFISINEYVDFNATDVYWNSFEEYRLGLTSIAQKAAGLDKYVQITEFGYDTADDALQTNLYAQYISIFKSTPNLSGWLSWGWDIAHDPSNPGKTQIGAYSIVNQGDGTPRPAFYAIA